MQQFASWPAIAGGGLIGLAASLLLVANGRVAGVSGMVGGLLARAHQEEVGFRVWFLLGLAGTGVITHFVAPARIEASPRGIGWLILAGLLVGLGTRLGSGCTSGHGVCGISRLSVRSLIATVTFVMSGVVTVAVLRTFGVGQ